MLHSVRVKNLRALRDTPELRLRRINILVGKNSSGKSTFLRLFPLLRQSLEVETKAPILWYGRLVDFGTFPEARTKGTESQPVVFEFKVSLPKQVGMRRVGANYVQFGHQYRNPGEVKVELELGQGSSDKVGYSKSVKLTIFDDVVRVPLDNTLVKKVEINGKEFRIPGAGAMLGSLVGLIPELLLLHEEKNSDGSTYLVIDNQDLKRDLVNKLYAVAHGNTSTERLQYIAQKLTYSDPENFFEHILAASEGVPSLHSRAIEMGLRSEYVEGLRRILLMATLPRILRDVDQAIADFSRGVRYVEPLRASAERYYRLQDLAVDEIDSRGANTAMFLHSLTPSTKAMLKSWMLEQLGFFAFTEQSEGHVAVKLQFSDEGDARNIADLGFGYSQVLPIILQLWTSCVASAHVSTRLTPKKSTLVAMEQPELHLHPNYQALIGNVLAAVVESGSISTKSSIPLVVETHSEHLVNRLGELIASGDLAPAHVQIIVFEDGATGSSVTAVEFDELGVLRSPWPLGFFVPGF